jgi:quercetin dioxygenase-like cupin family protein
MPEARPTEPTVEGKQIQAIAEAVNEYSGAVHSCWARAAIDDYKLEGAMVLGLEMDGAGQATASLVSDETGDSVLSECMVELWSSYQWPANLFAAGDQVQLPPFEFVAPDAQYSVSVNHVAPRKLAEGKLEAQVVLSAANSGNDHAGMSYLRMHKGMEVPLHTHSSAEVLFMLSGEGDLLTSKGPQKVSAGSAIYIPAGVVHGFTHQGEAAVDVLQLYTPAGPEQRFLDASNTAGTTPFTGKLGRRLPAPIVRHVRDVKPLSILGGQAEVRLLFESEQGDEVKAAYMGALTAEPEAVVPLHRHSGSTELLFVIEGQAEMRAAGKGFVIQSGDAVQIPPGTEHGARIVGSEKFKAIQFYTPAGPEQRFKGASK